ncbi:MAG: DDE-type integrase/transposase/recombinase [Candidatus Bathyarchaeia archaeon]
MDCASVDALKNIDALVNEEVSRLGNYYSLEILSYSLFCNNCWNLDVVKAGVRHNRRKGDEQRFLCNKCGKLFSYGFNTGCHLPLWVIDCVLFYCTLGLRLRAIPLVVAREGEIRTGRPFFISVPAVYSIIRRTEALLNLFEYDIRYYFVPFGEVLSEEWQIDDRYHNWKRLLAREKEVIQKTFGRDVSLAEEISKSYEQKLENKVKWAYMYPTCVIETDTCYSLAIYVGRRRDEETALRALLEAKKRATYTPTTIKCDGHGPFLKAIPQVLPNTQIISRTKEEDIGIVNAAETFWSIFNLVVPKRRFREEKTLASVSNITRHYLNMFRPHEKLGQKTPLEAVGFNLPEYARKSWVGLLDFAYRFHKAIEFKKRKVTLSQF